VELQPYLKWGYYRCLGHHRTGEDRWKVLLEPTSQVLEGGVGIGTAVVSYCMSFHMRMSKPDQEQQVPIHTVKVSPRSWSAGRPV
jgi:hypothetical protein